MLILLLLLVFVGVSIEASEEYGNRPRGVAPQKAAMYEQRSEFECLDGSQKIPFEQVNDDYCDCKDGSDEPGTSACSNGEFYCRNAGHRPLTVPSSRVNDFICDCCDGSDEWDSGVQCPNACAAQGVKAREEAKQIRIIYEAGYAKRLELAKEGAKSLEEKKTEVEKQKKELEELEPLKASAEAKKNSAEDRERDAKQKHDDAWNELKEERLNEKARELFLQLDLDKDDRFTFEEFSKFKSQFGEVKLERSDSDEIEAGEAAGIVQEIFGDLKELDFTGFRSVYEKVKDFVHEMKALASEKKDEQDKDVTDAPPKPPSPIEEVHNGRGEEEQEDGGSEEHEEGHDHEVHNEENEGEEEDDEDKNKPPYDEVTQLVIEEANAARREMDEISRKISDLESNIRSSESFLEFEYGNDHSWAPYKGQCAELTTSQYTYKLCLFDRSVQKDRNGHHEVNLGHWSSWVGPEENKFSAQMYDKGQSCWNGPERSTRVVVECGEELQLVEASEPSKCKILLWLFCQSRQKNSFRRIPFPVEIPAACANPIELDHSEHSEL